LNVREWIEISRSSPAETFRLPPPPPHTQEGNYDAFIFHSIFFWSHLYFFCPHLPTIRWYTLPGHILSSGYYRREEGSCWMRCRDDTVRCGDWKSDSSPTKWFLWTTKVIFSQTNVNCCPGDCKLIKHKLILFGWFIYFFSLKAKSRQCRSNNNNIYCMTRNKSNR